MADIEGFNMQQVGDGLTVYLGRAAEHRKEDIEQTHEYVSMLVSQHIDQLNMLFDAKGPDTQYFVYYATYVQKLMGIIADVKATDDSQDPAKPSETTIDLFERLREAVHAMSDESRLVALIMICEVMSPITLQGIIDKINNSNAAAKDPNETLLYDTARELDTIRKITARLQHNVQADVANK